MRERRWIVADQIGWKKEADEASPSVAENPWWMSNMFSALVMLYRSRLNPP